MLRPFFAFVTAATVACGTAAAGEIASRPLCDFVQKVLAAKPAEFGTLKGEAQNPRVFGDEVFKGTLLPAPGAECTLFVRTRVGRAELEPKYSCKIGTAVNFADANRIFARAAADLRACFAQARFSDSHEGDGHNPSESVAWTTTAEAEGFRLELEMSNRIGLIAQAMVKDSSGAPEIAITLDVTDTSPPRTPI
jgi:hypothetical protein